MEPIVNTPLGKPLRKGTEPAPMEVPEPDSWPTQTPVPERQPEEVPA